MKKSKITSSKLYKEFYSKSIDSLEQYWSEQAANYKWQRQWDNVLEGDFHSANIKWFDGGKLNITENCLDRHLDEKGHQIAVYWEPNSPEDEKRSFTYNEIYKNVNQFANVLKDHGVKKGDKVVFYMSMVPELMFGALACARIGAVHSIVFAGFSASALSGRVNDCEAKIIITNDESYRGAKTIGLKSICDEAMKSCPSVQNVLVHQRTFNKSINYGKKDIIINELIEKADDQCPAEIMNAEDPLFILYTSGSTGKPKGLVHTIGGYMVWAGETFKNVFQANDGDVFWCSADIGWITGHSYITYGPLLNGATQIMFEGVPTYPDGGRFWDVIDQYKVTHFYTAPTAIRALMCMDEKFVKRASLDSLKVLGSVGEPINEEAWQWYYDKIGKGRCEIIDTWWQTETGGIMISNLAGVTEAKACHATKPQPGVLPLLVDDKGEEILGNPAEGNLCIKQPWPGMARTIYGNHERYVQTYFSTYKGLYFTGDGAKRDKDGDFRITGRVDDVINVSGHRIGTAEVEDAIDESHDVLEAAVVGFPHEIKGQGIMAYAIISADYNKSEEDLLKEVNATITEMIGPIAKLDRIIVTRDLPKTRSGKIMRRILRKIAAYEFDSLGDTSTLLNPEIVDDLIAKIKGEQSKDAA